MAINLTIYIHNCTSQRFIERRNLQSVDSMLISSQVHPSPYDGPI